MQYWYSIKGDSSRRGLADELVLFEMVKNGKLKPTDLVWSVQTGSRWVPAATIEGMFSQDAMAAAAAAEGQIAPAIALSQGSRRHTLVMTVVVAAIFMLVACAIAFIAMKVAKPVKPLVKPDFLTSLEKEAGLNTATGEVAVGIATLARNNAVDSLRDRISACFAKDQLDDAENLIGELRRTEGGEEFVQRLSVRLNGLKRTALRKVELEATLAAGTLDKVGAEELLSIFKERKEEAKLQRLIEDFLGGKSDITPGTSLAAARLCKAAGWHSLQRTALREFGSRAPMSGQDAEYLEIVNMYSVLGEPLKGADILMRYLTNAPQSSAAWLELAAIRCSTGDSRTGMIALQQAIDRGGQWACTAARRDSRFDPVRDMSAFRDLIGIK